MKSKVVATALIVFILAGITTELGIWQLHRAHSEQKASHPVEDKKIYQLGEIASAGSNLDSHAINKLVSATGTYIANFTAPGQSSDPSKNFTGDTLNAQIVSHPVTLDVRVLELAGSNQSVLVVRGINGSDSHSNNVLNQKTVVHIVGRIYPRQTSDVTSNISSNTLTRLDPALVLSKIPGQIYDGYIVENSEGITAAQGSVTSQISMVRLPTPLISTPIAGYYWQHIAYVVIWWLFTLLILLAPFYNQLRKKFTVINHQGSGQ